MLFYLLLNGSGVGRCYDDDMMVVNWDHMPTLRVVLDDSHPDFNTSQHTSVRDAKHLYGSGNTVHWFEVEDSREGWAKAVEFLETMTFQKVYSTETLVIDFSKVRCKGSPIMGMQGRPSSGPVPLMNALEKIAKIKGAGMKPWRQAIYVDHMLACPVLVGGARRAARMSTKHWSDPDILDFIEVKRPIEYEGLSMDEVIAYREEITAEGGYPPMAFLWSSNNSVTVDEEFWHRARLAKNHPDYQSPLSRRAREVLKRLGECAYGDGTGEPGIINSHLIAGDKTGQNEGAFRSGEYVGSMRYQVTDETRIYLQRLQKIVSRKSNDMIVNPCGTCITGDTMVMTANGPRLVTDLIAAEFDALINGQVVRAGPFRHAGIAPIREIVTIEGYRLKCTSEHRLLRARVGRAGAFDRSTPVSSMAIGDQLVMSNQRCVAVNHEDADFEAGWVIGHVKGNGGHNPNNTSGTYLRFWHGHEYDLEVRADAFVRSLGVSGSYRGGTYNRTHRTWTIRSEQLLRFVDRYLHPRSKAIRPALIQGSTALIAGFLQGFFDSDGSAQGNTAKGRSLRLSQSDEAELLATQQMLARLGIMSTLALRRDAGQRPMPDGLGGHKLYSHKQQWEIIISKDNIEEFGRKVGFSNPHKRDTLDALIENLARKPNREMFLSRVKAINILPPEPVFDCLVEGLGIYDAGGFCSLTGIR